MSSTGLWWRLWQGREHAKPAQRLLHGAVLSSRRQPLPPTTLPPLPGHYRRAHNFGLNLFWCFWWPASFFIYPFLGRVWCAGELNKTPLTNGA